jgi:serine protease Do
MARQRGRVSRETRQLLGIVLLSMAVLWVLARVRFPDRPATPNPVPPVLAQLVPPSPFDAISSSIADLQRRVLPGVARIELSAGRRDWENGSDSIAIARVGLRFRDGLALAIAPPGTAEQLLESPPPDVVAFDPASALTIVRVAQGAVPEWPSWSPADGETPRFLAAVEATSGEVSLRPVFIGSLFAVDSAAWESVVWPMPRQTGVQPGTLMFTIAGSFAGIAVEHQGGAALVPAATLLAAADRLARQGRIRPGYIGVEVQDLTPAVAQALAATAGVVVSWVDPDGPASDQLLVADVIEQVNGVPVPGTAQWNARIARVAEGQVLEVTVRRRSATQEVPITAGGRPAPPSPNASLGLTLRTRPDVGAEVLRVTPGTAGSRAGLQPGDVIVQFGDVVAPTASAVSRGFAMAAGDTPIVVAIARGSTHTLVAVVKQP